MRHWANIGSAVNRTSAGIARRIFVRRRTNIRSGINRPLTSALLLAHIYIVASANVVVRHGPNFRAIESFLGAAAITIVSQTVVHGPNVGAAEGLPFIS